MAETKKKKKKGRTPRRVRKERRFAGGQTQSSRTAAYAGMVGALVLGAGVYAQWIKEPALEYAPYIVAGGSLVLGAAMWFGDSAGLPVRVGDAGIAFEKGSELTRLAWCDIETIEAEGKTLVVRGDGMKLELPLNAHALAASWILKEAARRVPEALDVKGSLADQLPAPKDTDGELMEVTDVQVAGKRCAASDTVIAFEKDARLCPTCGQVYHRDHVPKRCGTCDDSITGRVVRA